MYVTMCVCVCKHACRVCLDYDISVTTHHSKQKFLVSSCKCRDYNFNLELLLYLKDWNKLQMNFFTLRWYLPKSVNINFDFQTVQWNLRIIVDLRYILFYYLWINKDSVAQWIRRWSTEPEILGSIPSRVVIFWTHQQLFIIGLATYNLCVE